MVSLTSQENQSVDAPYQLLSVNFQAYLAELEVLN